MSDQNIEPTEGQPSEPLDPTTGQQAQQLEVIEFHGEYSDIKVLVRRSASGEIYLALQPPEAMPYVVAPFGMPINDVAAFVQARLDVIRELRHEMLKSFKKSKSLKCRFRSGDVVHLLGRPFMLRVYSPSTTRTMKKSSRGRANVKASVQQDVSVILLELIQAGNYDQGRLAFLSFAKPVFSRNITSLLQQCMQRVFPEAHVPETVNSRPMHNTWVRIDDEKDTVWFSESLIPYPPHAVVYAYLVEIIKRLAPDATEEEHAELLAKGVPNWRDMKALLADPNNPFAF
ncbi:MAG: M48 family metallopeptidase [Coriobacteriia bacterium]|nr:M48 family metallopeptidase [Coriobacteriia bacterium]